MFLSSSLILESCNRTRLGYTTLSNKNIIYCMIYMIYCRSVHDILQINVYVFDWYWTDYLYYYFPIMHVNLHATSHFKQSHNDIVCFRSYMYIGLWNYPTEFCKCKHDVRALYVVAKPQIFIGWKTNIKILIFLLKKVLKYKIEADGWRWVANPPPRYTLIDILTLSVTNLESSLCENSTTPGIIE